MKNISVVIPVYNGEQYIISCIENLLLQEDYMSEIIIINDGSTDNTREILSLYEVRNRKIKIVDQENAGVSAARNAGLDAASGDWIVFCDVDDIIKAGYFCDIQKQLEETDEYDLLCYARARVGIEGELNYKNKVEKADMLKLAFDCGTIENSSDYMIMTVWGKVFRRNILDKRSIRFNTKIDFGEDTLFMIEYILRSERFCLLHKGYYEYYINPQGACLKGGSIRDYYGYIEFDNAIQALINQETNINKTEIEVPLGIYMTRLSEMMRGRAIKATKELSMAERINIIHNMYKITKKYFPFSPKRMIKYTLINLFARGYIEAVDRKSI